MTKTQLKKDITEMINKKYNTVCEWNEDDINMLDYYYATFGKNCELKEENSTIVFSKSGYTSEVSVESWTTVSVYDEKNNVNIL